MTPTLSKTSIASPIGTITVSASEKGIVKVAIMNKKGDQKKADQKVLKEISTQLKEYFAKHRRMFDVPLDQEGTEFQKKVWKETAKIPFGKTLTYSDIAKKIGHPKAVRAVGTALGKNPLCIIVPCHRVLPKSGGVGNYAYGTKVKEWLLEFEKKSVSS